jgi:DNA-binding PadR family transcriptional regulator
MSIEHAILAVLDFGPQTGYDIKKAFDNSVTHFWSTTQSHIYKALEKLEEHEFVASRIIPQEGKPNRKEYHITKAGRIELKKWLSTPLPLSPVREAWMIQLFFAHSLSNQEIAQLVEIRKGEVAKAIEALGEAQAQIERQKQEGPPGMERMVALWQLTLDYGSEYYKSEFAWLEKTLKRVPKLPPLK